MLCKMRAFLALDTSAREGGATARWRTDAGVGLVTFGLSGLRNWLEIQYSVLSSGERRTKVH